jgi:transcriptional repressor of cell division inhibition gene dicB
MLKDDALRHYKTKMGLARALGISRQAIQGWGRNVPLGKAFMLQDLSKGKLKVRLELYRKESV